MLCFLSVFLCFDGVLFVFLMCMLGRLYGGVLVFDDLVGGCVVCGGLGCDLLG